MMVLIYGGYIGNIFWEMMFLVEEYMLSFLHSYDSLNAIPRPIVSPEQVDRLSYDIRPCSNYSAST
jgi:hypothetical protein